MLCADLSSSLNTLSLYVATVMSAILLHGLVVLPLLLFLTTGRNPFRYAINMMQVCWPKSRPEVDISHIDRMQALMCALGTASSTATLPCTIRCLEKGNQIDPRVTRLMLPLGTTINMDGTALFQARSITRSNYRVIVMLYYVRRRSLRYTLHSLRVRRWTYLKWFSLAARLHLLRWPPLQCHLLVRCHCERGS